MAENQAPPLLWTPGSEFIRKSQLTRYLEWLDEKHGLRFRNYDDLWEWSVGDTKAFWQSIWDFFEVISYSEYEFVHSDDEMPHVEWFKGATLNYAEHVFRQKTDEFPAIIFKAELGQISEISWKTLEEQVAQCASYLKSLGVVRGDRVVAYLPNIPEATVAFLAINSIGAIWSSCSPDFGSSSVVDRFKQIEPKVMIAVDGYRYNGKPYDKKTVVSDIVQSLPSLEKVIIVPYLDISVTAFTDDSVLWDEALSRPIEKLTFEAVPFEHPIWVLYSSGTTGIPKAITHSHGGVLLEHFKYLAFHNDVHPGERFFWYSTTGWMMWNFVQASFLSGATVVLYDGSPAIPDLYALWEFAEEAQITHFGTSAPYLVANMKKGVVPKTKFSFKHLVSISSTGAPLPPEAFKWVYENIKQDLWLCSMSGGTDVCTAFLGGVPHEPVYQGEIQRRSLGAAMYSYDEMGNPVKDEVGEMVLTKPMPSMPIYFWNDEGKKRYLSSYFEVYPGGIWRHGDWLKITSRNTLIILGRSDATLNRHGIRIGTAEIYRSINKVKEIKDSLIVNLELPGGDHYMPLFVILNEGYELSDEIIDKVNSTLRSDYTPRHVPDEIVLVEDIPFTISGKKLEAPVKKILLGIEVDKAANKGAMRNPDSLEFFVQFREKMFPG